MIEMDENIICCESGYDSEAMRTKTDVDLKEKVLNALRGNVFIQPEQITVRVKDRRVFLEGTVSVAKERTSAETCISDIFGIRSVINYITYHSEYST